MSDEMRDLKLLQREVAELKAVNKGLQEELVKRRKAEREIERLNEELSRRAAQLEATNKELEAFSYTVSHDLRGPLTSINGFSQVLLEFHGDKLDEAGREMLQRIYRATKRMALLIEDLLNLSLVSHSKMVLENIDLSALVKRVAAELQKTEPERKADFVIEDGLFVKGDARLLGLVMKNLLGNSWKYTSGRPVAHIEFGVSGMKGGKPIYFVKDNGIGFDSADAGKIFEAFQRLHDSAEFPGSGVGLATVRRIIERHGGSIWAEGEKGKDAAFFFIL